MLALVLCFFFTHTYCVWGKNPTSLVRKTTCFLMGNLGFSTMATSKTVSPNDCDNDRQPEVAVWSLNFRRTNWRRNCCILYPLHFSKSCETARPNAEPKKTQKLSWGLFTPKHNTKVKKRENTVRR